MGGARGMEGSVGRGAGEGGIEREGGEWGRGSTPTGFASAPPRLHLAPPWGLLGSS